jgi:NADH-quinone oxidoreductase subunit C
MPEEEKPEGKPAQAAPPGAPKPPTARPAPKPPATMAATPWEGDLPNALKEHFGERVSEFSTYLGQNFLAAQPEAVVPVLEFLRFEAGFDYLVDITAVDYPQRAERFDLVYILYSFSRNERVRVKTRIGEGYQPQTATGVHLTANWLEREVFDMFGIEFAGHPDLRRILLPEDWQGYPLRKDKPITAMDNEWVKEHLGIESGQ